MAEFVFTMKACETRFRSTEPVVRPIFDKPYQSVGVRITYGFKVGQPLSTTQPLPNITRVHGPLRRDIPPRLIPL